MSLLEKVEPDLLQGALMIVQRLKEGGFVTYFAGGAVRDLLLGRPVSDIDIATAARPEQIEARFDRTLEVGRRFGVMIVLVGSRQYEVTTFRSEEAYLDGRHPGAVHFTDARQDALRRDFTVNALFMDPLTEEIIDYAAGREDLERRLIRTVGDPADRFEEDKLRLLRAVRIACQLDFEIQAETFEAIRQKSALLPQVSGERIRDELLKILTGPDPSRGLDLLHDSGIMKVILPEIEAMRGVAQPPEYHPEGDVFEHTRLMFRISGGQLTDTLALGILLHDVGKPPTFSIRDRIRFDGHAEVGADMAQKICRRLRLSNEQTDEVVDLVKNHLRFIHVREMRESTLKRFLRKPNIETHLELHRLDCEASHGSLEAYQFCRRRLQELGQEAMRPDPLVDGHDLIRLGLKPGPLFSEILSAVEDLQLEGQLTSKEEALEWVSSRYVS